jgi:hypothetical protein
MKAAPVVEYYDDPEKGTVIGHLIFCPACECGHIFYNGKQRDKNRASWSFNGDCNRPTFQPSMLVHYGEDLKKVCHSFVTDGRILYLQDCTHEMAGKSIELPCI